MDLLDMLQPLIGHKHLKFKQNGFKTSGSSENQKNPSKMASNQAASVKTKQFQAIVRQPI